MNILPVKNVQMMSNTNFQAKRIKGVKLPEIDISAIKHDRFAKTDGNSASTLQKKIDLQTKWIKAEEEYLKEIKNRLFENCSEKQEYQNYRESQRIENTIARMKFELNNFKKALAEKLEK